METIKVIAKNAKVYSNGNVVVEIDKAIKQFTGTIGNLEEAEVAKFKIPCATLNEQLGGLSDDIDFLRAGLGRNLGQFELGILLKDAHLEITHELIAAGEVYLSADEEKAADHDFYKTSVVKLQLAPFAIKWLEKKLFG